MARTREPGVLGCERFRGRRGCAVVPLLILGMLLLPYLQVPVEEFAVSPVPNGPEALSGLYGVMAGSRATDSGPMAEISLPTVEPVEGAPEVIPPAIPGSVLEEGVSALGEKPLPPAPAPALRAVFPETTLASPLRVTRAPGLTLSWPFPGRLLWENAGGARFQAAVLRDVPLDRTSESARYPGAYEGLAVDVEYRLLGGGLKEDFVLRAPPTTVPAEGWLVLPFEIRVPHGLSLWAGERPVGEVPRTTALPLEFRNADGIAFTLSPPWSYEAGNASAWTLAEYRVSWRPGHVDLELRVPARWLAAPARAYPVVVDPTISAGDFDALSAVLTRGGPATASGGGDVAVGDLDGNGMPDAVFLVVDEGLTDNALWYWVCADINGTTGACANSPQRMAIGAVGWASAGAGIALAEIDGAPGLDAVFLVIDDGTASNEFRYWVCRNLSVTGDCGALGPMRSLSFGDWASRDGGAALVDLDGDRTLDAVFASMDPGSNRLKFLVCYGISSDGACPRTSDYAVLGVDLPRVHNAGIALRNLDGNTIPDLVFMTTVVADETIGYPPSVDARFRSRYQLCYDFQIAGTMASCYPIHAPVAVMDFDAPDSGVPPARYLGGGVALFGDLTTRGDLNGNGSLDALVMSLDCCDAGNLFFRFRFLLDGLVREERLEAGTTTLDHVPYVVLHDPSGDGSFSCLERGVHRELEVTTRVAASLGIGVEAKAEVAGTGGSAGLGVEIREAQEDTLAVSYSTAERMCTDGGIPGIPSERDDVGPGYGDVIVGENWTVEWEIWNRTYTVAWTPRTATVFAPLVTRTAFFLYTARYVRSSPDPSVRDLLEVDLGAENAPPDGSQAAPVGAPVAFSTGASLDGENVTATTVRRTREYGVKVTAETAAKIGLSVPGVEAGVKVTMKFSLEFGLATTSTTLTEREVTYHLGDDWSAGDLGSDLLRVQPYVDRTFGTWHFWTDENASLTSRPHEHWTGKSDTKGPRLVYANLAGNEFQHALGQPDADRFTLTVTLEDPSGLGESEAILWRDATPATGGRSHLSIPLVPPLDLSENPPVGHTFVVDATVQTLQGAYFLDVRASDTNGNTALYETGWWLTVYEEDIVDGAERKSRPGDLPEMLPGIPKLAEFPNLDSQGDNKTELILTLKTNQTLTEYSITAIQYNTTNPLTASLFGLTDADGAPVGVIMQIEASQNLDDTLVTVTICIGYDPDNLPAGTTEESLEVRWFNETSGAWESLPAPPGGALDRPNHRVCGISTHFSLYGPLGNWNPAAVLGFTELAADEGSAVAFDASASFDLDGTVVAYAWDFGDGALPGAGAIVSHAFGDDGTYVVTLTVTDNHGAAGTATGRVSVRNLAPVGQFVLLPEGPEGTALTFEVRFTDPGSDDLALAWDFGDGGVGLTTTRYNSEPANTPDPASSPLGAFPFTATETQARAYGDDGVYPVQITVTDDDGGTTVLSGDVVVDNVAPSAVLTVAPGTATEGSSLAFRAEITDPGSDDVTLTWHWDDMGPDAAATRFHDPAGTPDPPQSPGGGPMAFAAAESHAHGDDGAYAVTLTLTDDDGGAGAAEAVIHIENGIPTVLSIEVYVVADLTLRAAGEKWHDATVEIVEDGSVAQSARVRRVPGSPDDQSVTLPAVRFDLLRGYAVRVTYTPTDDPVNGQPNGATPVWVTLGFPDGEVTLGHAFNVEKPTEWIWEFGVNELLVERNLTFRASAADPGSDDLAFAWDFGDGTVLRNEYFNDGVGPELDYDPAMNAVRTPLGVSPIAAWDEAVHAFVVGGTHTIILVVADDDGGWASVAMTVRL